jgi:methylated-DNA-protein-cysteine methyltransferase related protein
MSALSADATAALTRRILDAVRAIPSGAVASYAAVGRRAGLPRGARRVARVLSGNEDPALPWHRVLRADGRIAFPAGSAQFREQVRRLRNEGVAVVGGRVRIDAASEPASLDALLWGPEHARMHSPGPTSSRRPSRK